MKNTFPRVTNVEGEDIYEMLAYTCDPDACVADVSSFAAGSHFAGEGSKPHIARVKIPQYMILAIAQD